MPTDKQPGVHSYGFYGYYISFDATGVEPVDHVLKAVADAGRGSHYTEYWKELGLEEEIQRAAERAAEELRSRDAEVQALREALSQLRDMAQVCIDRKAINPISHHAEALMLAEYIDKADAALSRAALGEAVDAD